MVYGMKANIFAAVYVFVCVYVCTDLTTGVLKFSRWKYFHWRRFAIKRFCLRCGKHVWYLFDKNDTFRSYSKWEHTIWETAMALSIYLKTVADFINEKCIVHSYQLLLIYDLSTIFVFVSYNIFHLTLTRKKN